MDMSTTGYDKEIPQIGASGSGNYNNYCYTSMREHMFDKVLTPSDVGKLNRLVIPKRHAENYFPLENSQNGTLLDFQDRNDKVWRFRYLYWNSSQSYVMTKGWIRFVKEKKLVAGDIVSFYRGYIPDDNEPEKRRKQFFIDWRHKTEVNLVQNINQNNFIFGSPTYPTASYYPVTTGYSMPSYQSFPPFYHNQFQGRELLGYDHGRVVGGRYYVGSPLDHRYPQWNLGRPEPLVNDSGPVFPAARIPPSEPPKRSEETSTKKKLRLFGVDVEESSSSGETRYETGVAGYSSSSPVVRDDDQSSWRLPGGEMGVSSSSGMRLSNDEEYKRKGKSLAL